ncbi:aromatic ring-hydroxylating dioxygenase subunit alpha [Paraburkholderia unamae]|uniref:Aromatic ring-hydroxylating dioxygenase subunit alpha n=1 Tax=Paraburkholderia unamae TaxID=219649 RepID=A0ACC6RF95_9BURK
MAISREDNELLTRTDHGAPLGEMLRQHYWIPVVPSAALEPGGAPILTRLTGIEYVVYRAGNGKIGIVDKMCPHRGASMALAMNEHDGLRCIFHGWKFSVDDDSRLIEAPNHGGNEEQFCKSIRSPRYRAHEAGGIVWAWFGQGEPPVFPDLPFTYLPEAHRFVTSTLVQCNWLQGVEATMDTTHAGALHQSFTALVSGNNERANLSKSSKPKFEFEDTPYGFRYAAVRTLPGGNQYARVNNFVMPWYGIITAPEPDGPSTVFFSVPVDDNTHRAWFVHFNLHAPLGVTQFTISPDVMNFPPLPLGDERSNWGQNRSLMKRGYFSGFPQHFATEDFAIFLSQGPQLDRSKENLCSSDMAVIRVRQLILKSVREFMAGEAPTMARGATLQYKNIVSFGGLFPADKSWRSLLEHRDLPGILATQK